ncbi:MAG: SoxR reducing system RseC family protein [Bacteroidales bacterium]|jgi:sigma-E factor negative regulatory protein RseC|nr:SoxR reducing system RseC family protein [Bacteroidales bacterium]
MEKKIRHEGIVISVFGNTLTVRIVSESACGGCVAKYHCVPSESKEKDIHVADVAENFVVGDRVMLILQQFLGFKAVCIGYLIPFVLSLAALLVTLPVTDSELAGGLAALLILAPYYLIVKCMRYKIDKTFGFTVQKIDH